MSDIAVYGAGGFGRETALMIQQIAQAGEDWNLVGFFDDGVKPGTLVDSLPVLGGMKELNAYHGPLSVAMAIADPQVRLGCVTRITNKGIRFPVLIHPSANTGSTMNVLDRGVLITGGVILTTGIRIGEFSIVNLGTTIGHDASIGPYASIMPQCSISGNVSLAAGTFIGAGARILQGVSLGEDTVVGAGAVVTKPFPRNSRLLGVPAQHIPAV